MSNTDNQDNQDNKSVSSSKLDKIKSYRHKYYEEHKEKLAEKTQKRKTTKTKAILELNEKKSAFVPEMKLFENKYNGIPTVRAKLLEIKKDIKILKYLFLDEDVVVYNAGLLEMWIVTLNNILVKNKNKITSEILSKLFPKQ